MSDNGQKFSHLIEDVAREIVATEHHTSGSFIRTPLLYPSGATVVVRIEQGNDRYFVSDWGLGYQETDLYGAGPFYVRHARTIAEKANIGFDNQAFFVVEATKAQLPGAVIAIGNCSQEAAIRAADALAEKNFEDSKERLYERLVHVFAREFSASDNVVRKNVRFIGHSTTDWPIATLVQLPRSRKPTIFEPVTKHHNSVAHATMKFSDIARLGVEAPNRVAVIRKKSEFGTYLAVLSQAASVIEDEVPDEVIARLARAA